ncbi:MAG TPA: carbamoyl-phosphate synthase large subunit [Candidatus Limnocylindrales bacterium]|nr:carbamoyl-phosphate synthase large subunit [Candidatus Limnocylindrales bacterium]
MPKREDIKSILIVGAGPIVIGQACEFDYSGTQACKALKEEGYKVILINSNPATIMTDPDFADRTYIEPMTADALTAVIAAERPDALLPTMGGQTALNLTLEIAERGVLDKYGVQLIGANIEAIKKAEDRNLFKAAMASIGLDLPRSGYVGSMEEGRRVAAEIGLPVIIRPSRTLGGMGANIAKTMEEYERYLTWALELSPIHEVLVEESIEGWKEFELEVMRDRKDNVVIVCSIENLDPLGVHTGDSITVAPAQTLTDKEYQIMRDASLAIIREIGVDTGGSNIQFAVNPVNGRMVIIEMNPRVSRSSALASKATGFPIAKIAAKLAVGYTLDEIRNDITRETPASFEPSIDYVVTKVPRFTFEKFKGAEDRLTSQMRSVGEAMAIGRTFKESLQKALRSLETGSYGFESPEALPDAEFEAKVSVPNSTRLWYVAEAFRKGWTIERLFAATKIDPWFLRNIQQIVEMEGELRARTSIDKLPADELRLAKQYGFSDRRLATLLSTDEKSVRRRRLSEGIKPVYKMVDTCAAEFVAYTPYLYSTYEEEDEAPPSAREKIIILGGGPNRIGQGIEFDYCCVHAAFALKEAGFETIMVNCNPETVSTDYDTSDRLYFEPLTLEDVLAIVAREKPKGVIVQFGGQTPLKLAKALEAEGVPIIGTSPDAIDRAEDRERFNAVLATLGLLQPPAGVARTVAEAEDVARRIGLPVLVRPSYVLGGRAMEIVHEFDHLRRYMENAIRSSPDHPILIDKFLDHAIEVDVDAISDGTDVVIGGIMEHIEQAGVHSGDSACSLPPWSLSRELQDEIRHQTVAMARELGVIGLMNVQFALVGDLVYVLEVNPRASRTVPFVSKAIGVPLAKLAARAMAGESLRSLDFTSERIPAYTSVKEAVFPFIKFPGVDTLLGPEMRSTGEVMGIDRRFGIAFAKAEEAAGNRLPDSGCALVTVRPEDHERIGRFSRRLIEAGMTLMATDGTARKLEESGLEVTRVNKVYEGGPHTVDAIRAGKVQIVLHTVGDQKSIQDSFSMRRAALETGTPYFTTVAGAAAAAEGVLLRGKDGVKVTALQDFHAGNWS